MMTVTTTAPIPAPARPPPVTMETAPQVTQDYESRGTPLPPRKVPEFAMSLRSQGQGLGRGHCGPSGGQRQGVCTPGDPVRATGRLLGGSAQRMHFSIFPDLSLEHALSIFVLGTTHIVPYISFFL